MKSIFQYIKLFLHETDKRVLFIITAFTALLIFSNYYFDLDGYIRKKNSFSFKLFGWYIVFLGAFAIPYLFYGLIKPRLSFLNSRFLFILFISPAIFALKLTLDFPIHFSDNIGWNSYWQKIIYWPLLTLLIIITLFIIWKKYNKEQPFYGIKTKAINWKPYWLMLIFMIPLIAVASTQPDFQHVYPKLKLITGMVDREGLHWWYKLLFELSYGCDFISIELFFRGFLILAFVKYAGKDAILPMACFYCTIHFGKPLGECISSYFGGILLGIVVYNTRSILGGLMVHLGIAWMMELGGYIAANLTMGL